MPVPTVFISYSRKDAAEKDELLTHLSVLVKAGRIDLWNDDRIRAGADWRQDIQEAMAHAQVAVLLVTANFLTSDFILEKEVPDLLQRRKHEGLTIFPIIAKPCAWKQVPWLVDMNVRPKQGLPVWRDSGQHADENLAAITEEIAALLEEAKPHPNQALPDITAETWVNLTIATPDGQCFAAEVPATYLVSQVIQDLLEQWQPAAQTPQRFVLQHPAWDNLPLDAALSLQEAGLSGDVKLNLIAEPLQPDSPVGLTVEDDKGARYTTAVRLNTLLGRLAEEFLRNRPSTGQTIVELLGKDTPEQLDLHQSLYEQGIGDGGQLRIYRTPENRQEY